MHISFAFCINRFLYESSFSKEKYFMMLEAKGIIHLVRTPNFTKI